MFHSKLRKHCFLPFQETEKQQGFFHHVCHHQQCYLCDWRQCESKKEFAITFNGEVIRQPINKSIKKISNNYKPLNNYKQDFHNSFYVWFSAQSFTGATCQIWLTLFKLESNKNKASFFDQERLQIWEISQNLLYPFTEWWSWHTKSLHCGRTHWMLKTSFGRYLPEFVFN